MTEENSSPGAAGESAFLGSGQPSSPSLDGVVEQTVSSGSNGLSDAQREVQKTIKEKRGVDIYDQNMFDKKVEAYIKNDSNSKGYYEGLKKEHINKIKRIADVVVEKVQRYNITQVVDEIGKRTGTWRQVWLGTQNGIPTEQLERDIFSLETDKSTLEKAKTVADTTISDLEKECEKFDDDYRKAGDDLHVNGTKAFMAEEELERLKRDIQDCEKKYDTGKITHDQKTENVYNISQDIEKKEHDVRMAKLGMDKAGIMMVMSKQSKEIYKYMLHDYYKSEVSKITGCLGELDYTIKLRREILGMVKRLSDKNILERNKIFDRIKSMQGTFDVTLESVKELLSYYTKQNQHYLKEGPYSKFRVNKSLLT